MALTHFLTIALFSSVLMSAANAVSQEEFLPETFYHKDIIENKGELKDEHITLLSLRLDRDTIQDVEGKLGQTAHIGENHHGFDLCYRSMAKGDDTVITFGTGIMGDDKFLLSFQIISEGIKFKHREHCRKSPLVTKEIATEAGLRLGLTPDEIKTILGSPTTQKKNDLFLAYETMKEKMQNGKTICVNIGSFVQVHFTKSKSSWLEVSKIGEYIGEGKCEAEPLPEKK